MLKDYNRLRNSLETEPWLTFFAIDFFTCSSILNAELCKDIKEILLKKYKNHEDRFKHMWIQMNRFSIKDFMDYVQEKRFLGNKFPMGISESVVEVLLKESVIVQMSPLITDMEEIVYVPNAEYAKMLKENNLLDNLLFGSNYIIEKYKSSVALIEIINKGKGVSVGTGFSINYKEMCYVVTNQHVVDKAHDINIYMSGQTKETKKIIESNKYDIAFIQLEEEVSNSNFYLNPKIEVLSDIITMGYPTIPMTKDAYQVYHKGEINSFVQDYYGNDLFLISAKTSSGNSGSPVIDKHGSAVGMITMELFEQNAFLNKGKLPYYAAIPSSLIISELDRLI